MCASPMASPAEVLRAFGERLADGDAEGAASLFTEDVAYAEPPAAIFTGRVTLRDFIADFAARHHDVSFTVTRTLPSPDGQEAAAEWQWAYTRDSSGERRVFEGMCFVTLRDGLIASWRGFSALVG